MPAQICGNVVAAPEAFPSKTKGPRMVGGGAAVAERQGFVSEEDAAQALLML